MSPPPVRSETNASRSPSGEYSGRDSFGFVRDEQARLAAGGGHGPDVAARDERDLRPVRRDRRFGKRRQRLDRRCRRLQSAGRHRPRDGRDN